MRRQTFGAAGNDERDRAAQRIACTDGLDVCEHCVAARSLDHAVEAHDRHRRKPVRLRFARIVGRQRAIGRDHEVGAEQEIRLPRQSALDAIGKKSDGARARGGEHQRGDQHRKLAGAPVAAQHP